MDEPSIPQCAIDRHPVLELPSEPLTDWELPNARTSKTDKFEPNRNLALTLQLELSITGAVTEILFTLPSMARPEIDQLLPHRFTALRDREEPTIACSTIERVDPARKNWRIDKVDAQVTLSKTESFLKPFCVHMPMRESPDDRKMAFLKLRLLANPP
jgi:hypothetical protein